MYCILFLNQPDQITGDTGNYSFKVEGKYDHFEHVQKVQEKDKGLEIRVAGTGALHGSVC